MNIMMTSFSLGLGLVIIWAMVTSASAPQTVFSQPTNATNATANSEFLEMLASHVVTNLCVYENDLYSPGSTVVVSGASVDVFRTCLFDGTWRS